MLAIYYSCNWTEVMDCSTFKSHYFLKLPVCLLGPNNQMVLVKQEQGALKTTKVNEKLLKQK